MIVRAYNIEWDTDGEEVDLPTEVYVDVEDVEEVAEVLSQLYGWLVESLEVDVSGYKLFRAFDILLTTDKDAEDYYFYAHSMEDARERVAELLEDNFGVRPRAWSLDEQVDRIAAIAGIVDAWVEGYFADHGALSMIDYGGFDSNNGDDDWVLPMAYEVTYLDDGDEGDDYTDAYALCDAVAGTVAEQAAFIIEQLKETLR